MTQAKALIVAAGRGIRMGPRGQLTPKGLLEIDGTPLVARSVALLQARGITDIRIVTGHLADQYETRFAATSGVTLIHNPDYATTGSLRSMMTGLATMDGPVIVLESDLVYEAAALSPVLSGPSTILVSGVTGSGDEVYIWTRSGAIFDTMSKNIAAQDRSHYGELTGLSRFDAATTETLKQAGQVVLAANPKADYEDSIIHMARDLDIACHRVPDLAWTEIDNEDMYARALATVWPRIQACDAQAHSAAHSPARSPA